MSSSDAQGRASAVVETLQAVTGAVHSRPLRIALLAGEASGDLLGAGLIDALRQRFADAQFAGIGGEAMRAAGCQTWYDASQLSLMGLIEVLRHLPRLLKIRRGVCQRALAWAPDVFIGIDAPDFNLPVERWLKRRGIATVHYVSPSVWAWKEKRAERIGSSADQVLCLFPMEPPIYQRHGVDARFVGHPMADAIPEQVDRQAARAALGLADDAPVLALLPGSRLGEIGRLAPVFLAAARQLSQRLPALQVLVPAATPACRPLLAEQLAQSGLPPAQTRLLDGQARRAMIAADVVLLASGTATLEAMLVKRPMVVGYRVAPLTARIVRALKLIKVDRYALPNILAGADLAPELIQENCNADALAAALLHWFADPQAIAALQPEYLRLHRLLRQDASTRAAEAISALLARRYDTNTGALPVDTGGRS